MKKRKQKLWPVMLAALLAVVVAAAVIFGIVGFGPQKTEQPVIETDDVTQVLSPAVTAEPADELVTSSDVATVEDGQIRIRTPFMTFYYPADFAQDVVISVTDTPDESRIVVSSTLNGKELELYMLQLSKTLGDGYQIGTLNTANGQVGVYVMMNEQNAADWSEEEFERINLLQETVNSLLGQVQEHANFVR